LRWSRPDHEADFMKEAASRARMTRGSSRIGRAREGNPMMTTTLLAPIVLLGQLASAPADGPADPSRARCGADAAAIARLVDRLETARFDLARYQAAVALRRFDVRRHPEIVPPLIGALEHDREDAVRAEAAISLAKLGANRPDVVAALRRAAASDRLTVRIRADWSLRRLARRPAAP
jgi:hypothetical protein